jgi:hypothetical protein
MLLAYLTERHCIGDKRLIEIVTLALQMRSANAIRNVVILPYGWISRES